MKTLRGIGVGIIFLTLSLPTHAETEHKILLNSIDEQFAELKKLDLEGALLAKDKEDIDKESIAYGHDYEEWYEASTSFQRYVHYIKAVIADFNTRCKAASPLSPACVQEKKVLDSYDFPKAQEFYRELVGAKRELDLRHEEIIGKPGENNGLWTTGKLGKNSVAGFNYIEKRKVVVEKILELQMKQVKSEKNYDRLPIPKPTWTLWEHGD